MSNLLRRLLTAWRMELRLVVRHWSYPLMLLGWWALVAYVFSIQSLISPEAALKGNPGAFSVGLSALAALLLGAFVAGRSQRTRFEALEETFPTGAEVLLGRWLACVVALLPTQVAAVVLASRIGPASSLWRGLPTFLLEAGIILAFAVSVGWLFVTWLGPRRWVYLLLAGGWLSSLGWEIFLGGQGLGIPGSDLFDVLRTASIRYEELWGRLMEGERPVWFNLFYGGLAALFVALVVTRTAARRNRRAPLIPAALALAALMLAGSAVTAYVRQAQAWSAQAIIVESIQPSEPEVTVASPVVVDAWEIAADLTDPASPRFDARLTLRAAGDEPISTVTLTLHHDLEIASSSVPYERDGDVLTLALPEPLAPGATQELHLAYGGELWTLVHSFRPLPDPLVFTTERGVRLPFFAGWYPVPGEELVGPDASGVLHPPGRFVLTVSVPRGWGIFTNLPATGELTFASDRATWAVLYASPRLRTERVDASTIIAPEAILPTARAVIPNYEALLAEYAPFFPTTAPDGVTLAVLDSFAGMADHTPPAGDQPLVVISQNTPEDLKENTGGHRYFISDALAADLWVLAGGDTSATIPRAGISEYLWIRHRVGTDPTQFERALLANGGSYTAPIARALMAIENQQGVDGVREIIARMIAEGESLRDLEPDQIATWIEEVGGAR